MVSKPYEWEDGAELKLHTARKHKVIREYFYDYLRVRCAHPQVGTFRIAVVDGFAGGGRYQSGEPGSPIIFLEELRRASMTFNLQRKSEGLKPIDFDVLLILNDANRDVLELLRSNVAPIEEEIRDQEKHIQLKVEFDAKKFEDFYPEIKAILKQSRYSNVVFNLDQCGVSHVQYETIRDIMRSFRSAEVFYTFMISALVTFLNKQDPVRLARKLEPLGISASDAASLSVGVKSKREWLGTAERLVYEAYKTCAPFVAPFSINHHSGWEYWLIHFAHSHRAREVYNNVLHANSSSQAHFGRLGIEMLSFGSRDEGQLYLFDDPGRALARDQLMSDIPGMINRSGDVLQVQDFRDNIYNETAAHSDDINQVLIESAELDVVTSRGHPRRASGQIRGDDLIKLKPQTSFFPLWKTRSRGK